MSNLAASASVQGPYSAESVTQAAENLHTQLGKPATVAFAFCTPDYLPHLEEFSEILRVDGQIVELVGCPTVATIEGAVEREQVRGLSILALAIPGVGEEVFSFSSPPTTSSPSTSGWIALVSPSGFDVEQWLAQWAPRGTHVIGGMASGGSDLQAFHNGVAVDGVAVGVKAPARLVPLLSQGCRPIGEPLTVTRAESNVVYALGARPAYEALESAFETLSDKEKATARGNLFAGLAGTEYVEEYLPKDFLVRTILGADPNSGAVAIGAIPRVGQTLQYQLRDPRSAAKATSAILSAAAADWGLPTATLLFPCTGRGKAFFGTSSPDASTVQALFGRHPSSGFFCSGEIAPVADRSCLHSYSLACAALFAGSDAS
jgi:small ligand-binding sensory domain FIST